MPPRSKSSETLTLTFSRCLLSCKTTRAVILLISLHRRSQFDSASVEMWLINTKTLELESVTDHERVEYAILSHTWDEVEVLFEDMCDSAAAARKAYSFKKIKTACRLAEQRGLRYAWVDTCCIDKRSSAELSEAINSMFRWYRDAAICFVYLSDLASDGMAGDSIQHSQDNLASGLVESIEQCRWFSRGWTLQELIAPRHIIFYDREWKERGTKETLRERISAITSIELRILAHTAPLDSVNIAKRMSWAAKRHTTRREDMAYCLLGIFDINMPMLYGEGKKAFLRLQEEICRRSRDLTLFAWELSPPLECQYHGLFAQHPRNFASVSDLERDATRMPYTSELRLSNKGIWLEGMELGLNPEVGLFMSLGCCRSDGPDVAHIRLIKTMEGYVRVDADRLFFSFPKDLTWRLPEDVYIPASLSSDDLRRLEIQPTHMIKIASSDPTAIQVVGTIPHDFWDPENSAFLLACTLNGVGDYRGLMELSIGKGAVRAKRYLMFQLYADMTRQSKWDGRPHIAMKHKIVDALSTRRRLDIGEWFKKPKMNRQIQEAIVEELEVNDGAPEGEGFFTWDFGTAEIPGSHLSVFVDVRQTSKSKGQAWAFVLSC
ncbi:uncharacterized protein JN550_005266 [Neoarthrinium moseri]|uniref:uncharacterized protein n=1 Tax=Neoarthrinium moseri TaxID=1658444 RepID=UPI001FDDE62A|nr:uncharacterized protein JN550_005266 [Neoarthrinium moseri]KAI1870338.1 hypothetical protein JN550_005266 [Neoarthrinium moseri]